MTTRFWSFKVLEVGAIDEFVKHVWLYHRGLSYSDTNEWFSFQKLPRVMLTFAKTHLYPVVEIL